MHRDERIAVTRADLRLISPAQREVLLAHVNGPRLIDAGDGPAASNRGALLRSGMLRTEPLHSTRPTVTALSDKGRAVVAHLLAEYADALVAAGFLEPERPAVRPIDVLRTLRERRASGAAAKKVENFPHRSGLRPGDTI